MGQTTSHVFWWCLLQYDGVLRTGLSYLATISGGFRYQDIYNQHVTLTATCRCWSARYSYNSENFRYQLVFIALELGRILSFHVHCNNNVSETIGESWEQSVGITNTVSAPRWARTERGERGGDGEILGGSQSYLAQISQYCSKQSHSQFVRIWDVTNFLKINCN